MTLPVSSYEELLAHVRSLTSETIQLEREITSSLSDHPSSASRPLDVNKNLGHGRRNYATHPVRRTTAMSDEPVQNRSGDTDFGSLKAGNGRANRPTSLFTKTKENEMDMELKEVDEKRSSPDVCVSNDLVFHRSNWGPESLGLWHSGPSSLSFGQSSNNNPVQQDLSSVISFTSSMGSGSQSMGYMGSSRRAYSHQQLDAKVEMVYSLLSMLGTSNREDMSKTLLAMSSSPESCHAMRQSGCLPLLIQLIHSPELDIEVRRRAAKALHNVVHVQTDDKRRRRESDVLKHLQQIREYCDDLKVILALEDPSVQDDPAKHPVPAIRMLMKYSFDAEHRQAICTLGGLHAIAELIQLDHEAHGSKNDDQLCVKLRHSAGMSLTNLTFGDGNNKALLCKFNKFMRALVAQLQSPSEELREVTSCVLRNLSWRADSDSKQALREVNAVTALMVAAMEGKKESTLKHVLSALWNLSAHCSMNKVDICSVPGALAFLVKMLKYEATTDTIIENAGGIVRNISSHIAVREDYRQILRDNNCFEILLKQLTSTSLTIVSNACGTLWNLSARCSEDQRRLWEMGATSMLRSLVQSKHKMISMGSSAALKNLLSANPGGNMLPHLDSTARGLGLQNLPSLFVRKQKALEQELDITLSETCDNIEPSGFVEQAETPTQPEKSRSRSEDKRSSIPKRSDSHESVTSTQSDSVYERVSHFLGKDENKVLESKNITLHGSLNENQTGRKVEEQKLMKRYRSSMIPTPAFKKLTQDKKNEKTKEENQEGEASGVQDIAKGKKATETKEKRGIPVLKNRIKTKPDTQGHTSRYGACFSQNNFPPQYDEEHPVNYSLKYPEREGHNIKDDNKKSEESKNTGEDKKNYEQFTDYAETDLDQPTDFSLKYGEETSSDEEVKNQRPFNYYSGDSVQPESEDTTRTYYTEGTPYEGTPYNFSSANSMSDLRIDPNEERDNADEKGDDRKSIHRETTNVSTPNEQKHCRGQYENSKKDYQSRVQRLSREYESGVSTPERPVQYCEEGTPGGCFSRVSSLSSLSGGKEPSSKNSPEKSEKKPENKDAKKCVKNLESDETAQNKVVTFGVTEQYACADQTPLMFSRCSSMNSLNSFEQINQSIPDDRSSVVSEFSRMTSGVVSPSELPDSPTQTVPPSPKRCKPPVCFPVKQEPQKKSVFEDEVATYKEEDTPLEFSRATSLSSLTIDNSIKPDFNLKTNSSASSVVSVDELKIKEEKHNNSLEKNASDELKEQIVPDRDRLELASVTEVDENILADCINVGIQETSRRPRQNLNKRLTKPAVSNFAPPPVRHGTAIPVKASIRPKIYPGYEASDDAVHTYHTEGTPANISHAGSHSDLSVLSVMSGETHHPASIPDDVSDDGSLCSGDVDNMLAECIQVGMPKEKPKERSRTSRIENPMGLSLNKRAVPGKGIGVPVVPVSDDRCQINQVCNEYIHKKGHHFSAKDELSTFETENSPGIFSIRSSLSDLTVNSVDSPACLVRSEANRGQSAHLLTSVKNQSQPSPSSISLIESEDGAKASDENTRVFNSSEETKCWTSRSPHVRDEASHACDTTQNPTTYSEELVTALSRNESLSSLSVESFDSCEPTPFEQAMLVECIHTGMPNKNQSRKSEGKNYKSMDAFEDKHASAPLKRLDLNVESRDERDHSKNVSTSSAAAIGENTAAGEKKPKNTVKNPGNEKMNVEQVLTSSTSSKTENSESQMREMVMKSSVEVKQEDNMNGSYGGHTWSEDYTSPGESSMASPSVSDRIEGLKVISDGSDNPKRKEEILLPNFKIGSEMTDSKFLQFEASKICREIRKYQEFDMAGSITSEVSLVSCSSFLDSGDFSVFDVQNETVDFESQESLSRNLVKVKNFPKKPFLAGLGEPISLPSLKPDQLDGIDLESSIISVASITSEIAETSSKDKESLRQECKNEETIDCGIDTATAMLDRNDETLNADTLGSDTEIFDDENSIHSQENLPLDSESSKDSTPKKLNRKLTPKEKRKTIQDRYRTYTIHDLKAGLAAEREENVATPGRKKTTPKQRRLNDRDRFLTRILGKEDAIQAPVKEERVDAEDRSDDETQSVDLSSTSSMTNSLNKKKTSIPKFRSSKIMKNSRKADKDRYRTRTLSVDSQALNDLVVVSPAERKELLDNAKLVAICLKTAAAHDVDSEISLVSDSETENSHRTLGIDTATYNKATEVAFDYRQSEDDYQSLDSCVVYDLEEDMEKRGPRILKPGEREKEDQNEVAMKAIRGRRKQLYSSPIKRSVQKNINSTPSSPKISQTPSPKKYALLTTKSLPNVPKSIPKGPDTPVLCREGTFTKEEGTVLNKTAKTTRSIPVPVTKKTEIRNKSAPVLRNNKNVSDNLKTTRPVSSYIAKNASDKNVDGNLNHKRHSSAGATSSLLNKLPGNNMTNTKRHSSSGTSSSMKNSPSNQSIKSTGSVKSTSGVKTKNSVSQSPKSQSNVSLDSSSAADKGAVKGKPKTPKKEVTSKIASLWKKVEESKKKEKNLKDNRVWITAEKEEAKEEVLVIEKEEILELPSGKIVRSSTFQGLGDGSAGMNDTTVEEPRNKACRNSGDFSSAKWETNKNANFEGRNVISAIVPPYNYNPPSSVRLASPTVKQVEPFHKSSMKVTTV